MTSFLTPHTNNFKQRIARPIIRKLTKVAGTKVAGTNLYC